MAKFRLIRTRNERYIRKNNAFMFCDGRHTFIYRHSLYTFYGDLKMLKVCHLELAEANELVEQWHRHHKPAPRHRFSIGVRDGAVIVGAAICGRPVSRYVNDKTTVEVTRLVTNGTKNACSFLYSACARAAKELGYQKIQTYILEEETGHSLIASGWKFEAMTAGGQWKRSDGAKRRTDQPIGKKQRWSKILA